MASNCKPKKKSGRLRALSIVGAAPAHSACDATVGNRHDLPPCADGGHDRERHHGELPVVETRFFDEGVKKSPQMAAAKGMFMSRCLDGTPV